jgi:outer membrane protein, heavy metal efflux system
MRIRIHCAVIVSILVMFRLSMAQGETPAKSASTPLTLDAAMNEAMQQNPELKALEQDVEAAKAKVSKSRSWEDPMVGVRFYQVPFEEPLDQTQDIDYIVRQKFPMGGKAKAAKEMAYHELQHHVHMVRIRANEILRDIKITYYSLFAVQRMIAVNREMETNLRSIVNSAQARLAANQSMATDAAQGQTEIAKLLLDREPLFQQKRVLEAKLKQLMASTSNDEISLPSQLEAPRWQVSLAKLLEITQVHHPSITSGEHNIEEKEWGVKAAKREYYPDLNVQTEYVQRPGPRTDAFTGELMLNVPLIFKKKQLGVKQAEAELASAQYMQQVDKNDRLYKVKELFGKMQESDRSLSINRATFLPQARQAFQVTSSAYSTGKASFFDTLNAVRLLFEAQMEYWKAFEAQAESIYGLEEAIGMTREDFAQWIKKDGDSL